jgi:hypothetical protein
MPLLKLDGRQEKDVSQVAAKVAEIEKLQDKLQYHTESTYLW